MPKQFQFGILYPEFLSLLANQIIMNVIHEGRNVKKFRELLGLNQQELSDKLGPGWSQKKVSLLEGKPEIDPPILQEVSKALNIPAEAIKNFDTDTAINNINNNFHDHSVQNQFNAVQELTAFFKEVIAEKDKMIQELLSKIPSSK
jgi:transcriptional regulator with XRE-family HTH domain